MYIRKQKQTQKYREQTRSFQWGERRGQGQGRAMELGDTNSCV